MPVKKPTVSELREREKKRYERTKRKNEEYNAQIDRVTFTVPKGRKADIKAYADSLGVSVNAFIADLVLTEVDRDKTED